MKSITGVPNIDTYYVNSGTTDSYKFSQFNGCFEQNFKTWGNKECLRNLQTQLAEAMEMSLCSMQRLL